MRQYIFAWTDTFCNKTDHRWDVDPQPILFKYKLKVYKFCIRKLNSNISNGAIPLQYVQSGLTRREWKEGN